VATAMMSIKVLGPDGQPIPTIAGITQVFQQSDPNGGSNRLG